MRKRNLVATLFLIVLLLALPAAAAIQTVWLNNASRGEIDRMRRALTNAARQIRADLSFEFASISTLLTPVIDGTPRSLVPDTTELFADFRESYLAWKEQTRFPDLIAEIVYVGAAEGSVPHEYDMATGTFIPIEEPYDDWVAETALLPPGGLLPGRISSVPLTLDLPVGQVVLRAKPTDGVAGFDFSNQGRLLVRLDSTYLESRVVADLADTYLGTDDSRHLLAVIDFRAERLVWSNFETSYTALAGPDSPPADEVVFVSPGSFMGFTGGESIFRSIRESVPEAVAERLHDPVVQQWLGFRQGGDNPGGGLITWDRLETSGYSGTAVMIWHSEGGIEATARQNRNRNLLFSYLALSVMAGSAVAYYLLFRRANRQREREHEFVASVTHELRTPVAAIHAAADNLSEGIVTRPDQVKAYGSSMLDEGRRLRTMIDQVLLYSGLQGSSGRKRLSDIDLNDLVSRACTRVAGMDRDHLIVRVEPNLPRFRGDPVAIESIMRNLLSNASKHNDESTTVSLNVRTDHSGRARRQGSRFSLVIEVSDDGRGIPRRELHRVREPFFRGTRSQADQVPGSGLGLSLVSRIADTYGGSLAITSTPGQGTSVVVRLPFQRGDDNAT